MGGDIIYKQKSWVMWQIEEWTKDIWHIEELTWLNEAIDIFFSLISYKGNSKNTACLILILKIRVNWYIDLYNVCIFQIRFVVASGGYLSFWNHKFIISE